MPRLWDKSFSIEELHFDRKDGMASTNFPFFARRSNGESGIRNKSSNRTVATSGQNEKAITGRTGFVGRLTSPFPVARSISSDGMASLSRRETSSPGTLRGRSFLLFGALMWWFSVSNFVCEILCVKTISPEDTRCNYPCTRNDSCNSDYNCFSCL